MIPLSKPDIGPEEEQAVLEVLRSGMLAMGERSRQLEAEWADHCEARHAIFMSNGTVALEAILRGLGIGPGDEVITVSFTFNATVSAILLVGATPVFVDVREDDLCMDPSLIEAAITPRTRAIMPVHMYGLMADMAPIVSLAGAHGLEVIQDAAQAVGATYQGAGVGRFGHAMYSLYATKNVTSGEGGMVTTDDDRLADAIRSFRNHGMRVRYRHESLGSNLKPTDLAAAIGLAQLAKEPGRLGRRRENARRLTRGLDGYLTPAEPDGRTHTWHQYTVRFPGERDEVAERLQAQGVGSMIYYPIPVHRQPYMASRIGDPDRLRLPVTDRVASDVLSIPVRANLTDTEVDRVIEAVLTTSTPRDPAVAMTMGAA